MQKGHPLARQAVAGVKKSRSVLKGHPLCEGTRFFFLCVSVLTVTGDADNVKHQASV